MKRKINLFLALTLIFIFVTGCSASVSNENNNESNVENEYPERTIAGTVAVAEMLDLLEIPMVGVPNTQYDLPESCEDAEKIGQPMNPDVEIVKSLKPDIFISVSSLEGSLKEKFENADIQTLFVDNNSYDSLLLSIKQLGEVYGKQDLSESFINEVNAKVENILEKTEGQEKPKVLILFGSPENIMLATEKSFVGSLAKKIGCINVAEEIGEFDDSYIPLSMEDVLKAQPDIILRLTHASPEDSKKMFEKEFSENPIWQNIKAVKEEKVYDLDNQYFGVSGNIRIITAVEELSKIIYGLD